MNIVEELFYGNINPIDKVFEPGSQYARFAQIVTDNEEKLSVFLKALPNAEEECHLLSQMINAQSECSQCFEMERFMEGFRLGAGIMLDTFILPQKSVIRDM